MSALTIELDTLTEKHLKQRSVQEGRKQEELAAVLLAGAIHAETSTRPQEIELLRIVREELSDEYWKRYRRLSRKMKAGTIADTEYTELLDAGNQIEAHHVKRLEAVLKLAETWDFNSMELMKLLGVTPRNA